MSTTEDRVESKLYELAYLILPSIPEDKLGDVVTKIKEVIKKHGGVETSSEDPFLHPLAYSMSKTVGASKYVVDEAYIGWVKFEAEASGADEVKKALESIDEVLRSLLVKVPYETGFTFESARAKQAPEETPEVSEDSEESSDSEGSDSSEETQKSDDSEDVVE